MKDDKYYYDVVISSIKRHTIKPIDFLYSKIWEKDVSINQYYAGMGIELDEGELSICSVLIDIDNWTILTTRKIITSIDGIRTECYFNEISNYKYNAIRDYKKEYYLGDIILKNGENMNFLIESGKASMIMIYGIKTRSQINGN
jgi:hypothetical protein